MKTAERQAIIADIQLAMVGLPDHYLNELRNEAEALAAVWRVLEGHRANLVARENMLHTLNKQQERRDEAEIEAAKDEI